MYLYTTFYSNTFGQQRLKMREYDRGYANTFSSHWLSHSCEMDSWTGVAVAECAHCVAASRYPGLCSVQVVHSGWGQRLELTTAWHILSVAPWRFAGSTPLATSCDTGFCRLSLQFALRKKKISSVRSKMCRGFWFVLFWLMTKNKWERQKKRKENLTNSVGFWQNIDLKVTF